MLNKIRKTKYGDHLLIFIGTIFMAVAVNTAFDTNHIADGGFSGIAIVVKYLTQNWMPGGVPLWATSLVLNLPLFGVAYKLIGPRFLEKSLFGWLCLTFWLWAMPALPVTQGDLILGTLFGGAFTGVGVGLVFLGRGSTGGTDMLATLIHRYVRHIPLARLLWIIDAVIIVTEGVVFGADRAIYSVVAAYIVTRLADRLIEGSKTARLTYIMTDRPEETAEEILKLDLGVTGFYARGMYQQKDKMVLMCAVDKRRFAELEDLVVAIDPKAFVIIADAREVLGEGFNETHRSM